MTKSKPSRNSFGWIDYKYSIVCDICGSPLRTPRIRGVKDEIQTSISWGEIEGDAEERGWIVAGKTAISICRDCLESIGR